MNRTNICKNIVQSVKDYIKDQVKLEPHRVEKHFVRRRKLSLLQVIVCVYGNSGRNRGRRYVILSRWEYPKTWQCKRVILGGDIGSQRIQLQ